MDNPLDCYVNPCICDANNMTNKRTGRTRWQWVNGKGRYVPVILEIYFWQYNCADTYNDDDWGLIQNAF